MVKYETVGLAGQIVDALKLQDSVTCMLVYSLSVFDFNMTIVSVFCVKNSR
jgi:hypothetical protein